MAIKFYSDMNTSPYRIWGTTAGYGLPGDNGTNRFFHFLVIRPGDLSSITPDWRIPVFWQNGTSTHMNKFGINSSKQFYAYVSYTTAGATTLTANTVTIDPHKWYVLTALWTGGWPFEFHVYELENPFTPDVTIGTALQNVQTGIISDSINYNDGMVGFGFNGGSSSNGAIISHYAYWSDDSFTESQRKNYILGKYPEGMPFGQVWPDIEYRFNDKINGESKNVYFDGINRTTWNIQAGSEWTPDPLKFLDEKPEQHEFVKFPNKNKSSYVITTRKSLSTYNSGATGNDSTNAGFVSTKEWTSSDRLVTAPFSMASSGSNLIPSSLLPYASGQSLFGLASSTTFPGQYYAMLALGSNGISPNYSVIYKDRGSTTAYAIGCLTTQSLGSYFIAVGSTITPTLRKVYSRSDNGYVEATDTVTVTTTIDDRPDYKIILNTRTDANDVWHGYSNWHALWDCELTAKESKAIALGEIEPWRVQSGKLVCFFDLNNYRNGNIYDLVQNIELVPKGTGAINSFIPNKDPVSSKLGGGKSNKVFALPSRSFTKFARIRRSI